MVVSLSSTLAVFGTLAVLLGFSTKPLQPVPLQPQTLVARWDAPWVERLTPDPVMEGLVAEYLKTLDKGGWRLPAQGLWLQAGSFPVIEHQGQVPLPAASLTKIATTLAALETWGVEHQFETRIGISGTLQDGVVQGDLVVLGGGDPLFVWEEAIAVANDLQRYGIQRVTGNLVVLGDFAMNFQTDPMKAGSQLRRAFDQDLWPRETHTQFATLPAGTPAPTLRIDGGVRLAPKGEVTWLMSRRSLPMVALLKAMNTYSNNTMAEMIAAGSGGAAAVMAKAQAAANLPSGELQLTNGSGLGEENQMSARAVVAMLIAMQGILQEQGFSVADVMPVAGKDMGTLRNRQIPAQSAAKTGSLSVVSCLAGFVPTAERGPVWFAIINGGWNLEELRAQQDLLLQTVQGRWGVAPPPPELREQVRLDQAPYRLGDSRRNQRLPARG